MLKKLTTSLLMGLFALTAVWAQAQDASQEKTIKVLRTSNKAQTNHYVCEAFEFENVNPYNLVNFFWAVTSREEGGIYAFAHPEQERGFLVVICPEYQLPTLRKLAQRLDRPRLNSAPGSKYIYYRMNHRNASDPNFIAAASFFLGATGLLVPDLETNSMLIYDAPQGAMEMQQALEDELDKPLPQVQVNVKVIEIDVNNDGTLGLDFNAWKNGPGALLGQFGAEGQYANFSGSGGHQHFNTRSSGFYLNYPSAYFDFLVKKGKAKALVDTKIAAVNRAPAWVQSTEEIRYYEVEASSSDRDLEPKTTSASVDSFTSPFDDSRFNGGNVRYPFRSVDPGLANDRFAQQGRDTYNRIASVDTGVSLIVVPTIGRESIDLGLDLEVVNHTGYDGAGVPLLSSRTVNDVITVADGDQVIFGGLAREQVINTTQKVPFFGSLPVLGYLFGKEISTTKKTVVVTIIQPELIEHHNNVTEEDRSLVKKQLGEEVVVLPKSEFCFEQSPGYTF